MKRLTHLRPEDKPLAEQLMKTLKEEQSRLTEQYKSFEKAQIDLANSKAQTNRLEIAMKKAEWAGYMFNVGTWAGFVMMYCGFALWWYKVQRHLDAKLKRESGMSSTNSERRRWRQDMLGRHHKVR